MKRLVCVDCGQPTYVEVSRPMLSYEIPRARICEECWQHIGEEEELPSVWLPPGILLQRRWLREFYTLQNAVHAGR